MRVLTLTWEYPPNIVGGLGQHVADLVPALARLGLEVHVVTPGSAAGGAAGALSGEGGYPVVHRVPPAEAGSDLVEQVQETNLRLMDAAAAIMDRSGPFDLLHAHDWLVSFAARDLKQRFKLPLLATIHATESGRSQGRVDNPLSWRIHRAECDLTDEAWRVIVCSNFMAGEVIATLGTAADKVDVIPNGVDVAQFDVLKGEDYSDLRGRFALPDERLVFNVGRMVREKGVHVLVEAMPLVLAAAPQAKFVVAGKPDPWGYWAAARARAAALGVGSKAYFTGFLNDAERDRLLVMADVAVFPSLYEPFGIVALQAMAAGAPVVAASTGGLAEVVVHELTGLTAYPDSAESLAWAVSETLRYPKQARARAAVAYARVVSEYNWPRIAQETIDVYQRVVGEWRSVTR